MSFHPRLLSASVFVALTSHACPGVLGFCVSVFLLLVFSDYLTWLQARSSDFCCVRLSEAHLGCGSAQNPRNTKGQGPGSPASQTYGQGPDEHGVGRATDLGLPMAFLCGAHLNETEFPKLLVVEMSRQGWTSRSARLERGIWTL